jgi:hypothetical protein
MAGQIRGIENQQNGVRFGCTRHSAHENVVRNTLVFRARFQAIDSWEVNKKNLALGRKTGSAGVLFHCDTREVRYLLT